MNWKNVGGWLKSNAGTGAALVGSLLTGNAPAAVAAGVALVSSATGTNDPQSALQQLQTNPDTVVRLKELAIQEEDSIRGHIRKLAEAELNDKQSEHQTTQDTIRSGDNSDDAFVRRSRPAMTWCALAISAVYIFASDAPSIEVLMVMMALPYTYFGLRQLGKGVDVISRAVATKKATK